jgi:hypothetical protein
MLDNHIGIPYPISISHIDTGSYLVTLPATCCRHVIYVLFEPSFLD